MEQQVEREELEAIGKLQKEHSAKLESDDKSRLAWQEWRSLSKSEQRDHWLRSRRRPVPQDYGVSAQGAERLVAAWLEYLGEEQVNVTQFASDGGVDVTTKAFCCQVKNYEKTLVSVSEVREIFGVATARDSTAMIFTSSALTEEALKFCEDNGLVAISFSAQAGKLAALSAAGRHFLIAGEYSDSIITESVICIFCQKVYSDPNTAGCECGEYKGIMTIAEWEFQTGETYR